MLDPTERKLRAALAGHVSWASTDTAARAARTANGRAALEARFLAEAGGDPVRAESMRKAFFTRLYLASARSRRVAREAAQAATDAVVASAIADAEVEAFGGTP